MKSTLLLFSVALIALNANSQTRTSIANGNATNPFTWDCTCVPSPGNNIIINHNVSLDADFGYSSGSVLINASGSLIGSVPTRAFAMTGGSFTNNGTFTVGNYYHGGGTFSNTANFTVLNIFASDLTAITNNTGTFTATDTLYINTNASFNNNNMLIIGTMANTGTYTQNGSIMGGDYLNSGTSTFTSGAGSDLANFYNSGTISNSTTMTLSGDLWTSENFTNSALIDITNDYWNGDTISGTATFTNNGTISVGNNLTNSEAMNGSGDYCIANSSTNGGAVTGTLDICDQTGGAGFDINVGTVAGTVTFCAAGPCALGITDNELTQIISVTPNPFNSQITLQVKNGSTLNFVLLNSLAQEVYQSNVTGNLNLDMSAIGSGIYIYKVSINGKLYSGKLIKE